MKKSIIIVILICSFSALCFTFKNNEQPVQKDNFPPPYLSVANTKMNVIYKGIRNPISFFVDGIPDSQITASCNNGALTKDRYSGGS